MSLIPLLFSNWWEDLDQPHSLFNQDFGLGLYPDQLLRPRFQESYYLVPRDRWSSRYSCPRRQWLDLMRKTDGSGTSTVQADKEKFEVVLDVQQFKPEEISVKVVDGCVVVEGKHEEKQDEHGWISRQFVRKYLIPEQCDIDQVTSSLSSDAVLTITAPRKEKPKTHSERSIAIEKTGKPALQEKPTPQKEQKEEKEKAEKVDEKK